MVTAIVDGMDIPEVARTVAAVDAVHVQDGDDRVPLPLRGPPGAEGTPATGASNPRLVGTPITVTPEQVRGDQ